MMEEWNGVANTLTTRYVYADVDEPVLQMTSAGVVTYIHHDHHDSVIAQSNATTGAVGNKYQYGPFGESAATLPGTTFGYTGQRYDSELGLYHYKARYFHPGLGRFLQPDPVGYSAGMNLYAYCSNDGLNRADPDGTKDIENLTKYIPPEKVAKVSQLVENVLNGRLNEIARGADANKKAIDTTLGRYFPDKATSTMVDEFKRVNYQALTKQIQAGIEAAEKTNRQFRLTVQEGTKLSGPLLEQARMEGQQFYKAVGANVGRVANDPNVQRVTGVVGAASRTPAGQAIGRFIASPVGILLKRIPKI